MNATPSSTLAILSARGPPWLKLMALGERVPLLEPEQENRAWRLWVFTDTLCPRQMFWTQTPQICQDPWVPGPAEDSPIASAPGVQAGFLRLPLSIHSTDPPSCPYKLVTGFLINKACDFYLKQTETEQCAIFLKGGEGIKGMIKNSLKCMDKVILNTAMCTAWAYTWA